MTYQNYEFTAFAATDLGLGYSANCGETFTMPSIATVCINVSDNDSYLSGDNYSNEHAEDYYGQKASITGANGELGNGGQIYAESYFWVSDQHGNWYVMVEIEQEGTGQDFLAFYTGGGYTTPPAGAQLTIGSSCNVSGNWINFGDLDAGEKSEPLGSVGGRLFIDSNHDNTEVDGAGGWEAGFDGATVRLLDAHGNVVATTTTDHYGTYKFTDIAAGDYTIHFEEPGGFDFVAQNVGHDGADSDVNQTSGKTASVHIGAGQDVWNVDAGIKEEANASIKGRLFVDSNHDNTEIDANHGLEAGYDGATVTLLDAHGNVVATTTTDADGNYTFEGLNAGNYVIHVEEPDGYGFVKQDQGDYRYDSDVNQQSGKSYAICLKDNQDVCDIDIGIKQETGAINGTVFCDTDCDGKSAETTIVPGETYTVEAEDMELCYVDVVHGAQASGGKLVKLNTTNYYDDGYLKTHFQGKDGTYDIKLAVQDENDGQSTIYVKVNGHLVEAVKLNRDSDGAGSNDGGFSTFVIKDVDLSKGDNILLLVDGNCSEFVRIDKLDFVGADTVTTTAEPVKSGVTINLLNAAGDIIATTTTDDNGNYHFNNIPVGDYTIMGVAPDGTEFTIQDVAGNTHDDIDSDVDANGMSGTISVVANGNTDIDLGVCDVKLGSLSGTYFFDADRDGLDNDGANGIAGITVELLDENGVPTGATTVTDANGDYSFGDLEAGTYGVKFTDPDTGRELTTQNAGADDTIDSDAADIGGGMSTITGIVVVAGADTPDNDAGVVDLAGALSGTYFCDEDRNGVDDGAAAGDADVAGKIVTLLNADGTPATDIDGNPVAAQITDANGDYRFDNLAAGDYRVSFEEEAGKEFIAPNVGDDADDSDVTNPATGTTDPVTVVAGAETTDVDAGVQNLLGSISGTYFCDEDRDGIDDGAAAGDKDVADKRVNLIDGAGDVIATTTTDTEGNYSFTGLSAGDYKVMFEEEAGKEFIAQDVGGDDTIDSDVNPDNGMTGVISVVAGAETTDVDAGVQNLLGSLSGRFFCDDNEDGLDNDGPDNGVEGVEVQLLDAAGNPIAGRTTTTDAQGNYTFTGLVAGAYGVLFADAVSGKVLTTQDVDGDVSDDIDSDASDLGGGQSIITGITVVAGQDTPDNDAGVVAPNENPTATDDAGKGCADTDITVDFSDNYADADSASVGITMINGEAIAQGDTITLANGVEVTLTDGDEFIFNGEDTYAALDIGEEATETFTVKVEDNEGGSVTASIDVTFCGDANSVESFQNSLPASGTYELAYSADGTAPFGPSAFDLRFLDTGDARFDNVLIEEAYCLDFNTAVRTIAENGPVNVGAIFGSQSVAATSAFDANTVSNFNGLAGAENLDLINWIVAQDFEAQGFSGWEVQFAVWELADNFNSSLVNYGNFQNSDAASVQQILTAAAANEGFEFATSGSVGIIVDPGTSDTGNVQPFIVGLDWETYDCLC